MRWTTTFMLTLGCIIKYCGVLGPVSSFWVASKWIGTPRTNCAAARHRFAELLVLRDRRVLPAGCVSDCAQLLVETIFHFCVQAPIAAHVHKALVRIAPRLYCHLRSARLMLW